MWTFAPADSAGGGSLPTVWQSDVSAFSYQGGCTGWPPCTRRIGPEGGAMNWAVLRIALFSILYFGILLAIMWMLGADNNSRIWLIPVFVIILLSIINHFAMGFGWWKKWHKHQERRRLQG